MADFYSILGFLGFTLASQAVVFVHCLEPLSGNELVSFGTLLSVTVEKLSRFFQFLLTTAKLFDFRRSWFVLANVPEPDGMNSAAYKTVRKLLDSGNCWMKVSGAYIQSKDGPPDYADSSAVAKSFIAAAPERCLWATNWPFPDISAGANAVARPDALPFFNLFGRWVPDAGLRNRILVENPEKLYGFDPANRPKPI